MPFHAVSAFSGVALADGAPADSEGLQKPCPRDLLPAESRWLPVEETFEPDGEVRSAGGSCEAIELRLLVCVPRASRWEGS